jgi:hypothetical protein
MSQILEEPMTTTSRWGWGILVTLSALLGLNGLALYLFIVDTQAERTIGVLLTAFAALAFMVALEGFRHGTRWAWNASWVVVVTLAAVGVHSMRGDRVDLPVFYLLLAGVALAGQLLAWDRGAR